MGAQTPARRRCDGPDRVSAWCARRQPVTGSGCAARARAAVGVVGGAGVAGGVERVSSAVRCRPTAPRLSSSCSRVRAPRITEVTPGRSTQPGQRDLRHRDAARRRRSHVRRRRRPRCARRGCAGRTPRRRGRGSRPAASRPWAARRGVYLPVSQPPPSGDQGSSPSPLAEAAGTTSHSISRASRLYCGCSVTGRARPRNSARSTARCELPAGEVGQPDVVHLAGAHGVVEEAQRLLQRRPRVVGVHLVEVDAFDAEPAQRSVERRARCRRDSPTSLGPSPIGKRPLVASTTRSRSCGLLRQPAPDDLLGRAARRRRRRCRSGCRRPRRTGRAGRGRPTRRSPRRTSSSRARGPTRRIRCDPRCGLSDVPAHRRHPLLDARPVRARQNGAVSSRPITVHVKAAA